MFLDRLESAKSNIPEHKDGRIIYEKFVKPAMVDRQKVAAHYALISLFEQPKLETQSLLLSSPSRGSSGAVNPDAQSWSSGEPG